MQKIIEFADKVALNENADIPEINKVTDDNINEIKAIVNGSLQGTNAMGSIVVDDVNCKNLFDGLLELGNYSNSTGAKFDANNIYRNTNPISVKPNTTYTFSINGVSQKYCTYYYGADGTFLSYDTSLTTGTFTTPANCYYVNFRCFGSDFTNDYATLKVQLEIGEATAYTPYKNFENEEVYSENEIKIGTWIDGKPLYRKTYQTTNIASTNTNIVDITNLNIDTPVRLYGMIISSTGNKFVVPSYDSSATYNIILVNPTSIRGRAVLGDGGSIVNAYITIEYTKTTSGTRMLSVVNEEEEENR